MKVKFHNAKKILEFYSTNFGFRKPYQILIDGTFCFAALKNRVNIKEYLHSAIGAEDVKLLTTKCIIMECEVIGPRLNLTASVAKQYGVHRCAHSKTTVTGAECIQSMVEGGNPNRYIIATQDDDLKKIIRNVPGIPHIYFNHSNIVFAKPAKTSYKAVEKRISSSSSLNTYEEGTISKLKEEAGLIKERKRKKKKKGGPNPLSCKKPKTVIQNQTNETNVKRKRIRHRLRLPEHVKAELMKAEQSQ